MCIRDRGNVDARADGRRDGLLDQVGMAGAGFFRGVEDGTPVSYTHLDVYKRQTVGSAATIRLSSATVPSGVRGTL